MEKSMRKAGVAAFILAIAGSASVAKGEEGPEPKDKVSCRMFDRTGTILKKTRVCKTSAQWKKFDPQFDRNIRKIFEQGAMKPQGGAN
jgi:hypothetical protein